MRSALLNPAEVFNPIAETSAQKDHRFFDPRSPEQPEQVLGITTEAILRLGSAATALGVLSPRVSLGLFALPDAIRLVPLVQEMQSGVTLTPEDVRPYRKPIKKLSMEVNFADKVAVAAGALAVGIPLRRALNRRIEREFPVRAAEAIDKAREAVASIEREVDFVASFENPQEEFVGEINALAETVSNAITQQRDRRVHGIAQIQTEPETARGMAGFFTKAVRKVRSFFNIFKRNKPTVNPEVTAYDAGAGIAQILHSLVENQRASENRFPLLSKLIFNRLPNNISVSKDRLALVAPEILHFLFSTTFDESKANYLIDSVNRNPHELRFITRFKKRYGHYSLVAIQSASTTLLPAIRDVLPTEGAKIRQLFEQVQELLCYKQPDYEIQDDSEIAAVQSDTNRKSFRNRLKSIFSGHRKKFGSANANENLVD